MDKVLCLLKVFLALGVSGLLAGASLESPDHRHDGITAGVLGSSSTAWSRSQQGGKAVEIRGRRDSAESGVAAESAPASTSLPTSKNRFSPRRLSVAQLQNALNAICVGDGDCGTRQGAQLNPLLLDQEPAAPAAPADAAVAGAPARVVTIEDVARFLPAAVPLHAEPDGWAVVGVPANFWTYVQPVTVEGELLGEQAAVRFMPQLYRWNYGDGAARTTRTGGADWAGLALEELSPTSTSHVYATEAATQASVTVFWSAEYRFAGSDWLPVAGAVSNASPQTRMLVVTERTVLTAG